MLVLLISEVAVSPFQDVLVMLLPGANRARQWPAGASKHTLHRPCAVCGLKLVRQTSATDI